jgi:hypothetical protein
MLNNVLISILLNTFFSFVNCEPIRVIGLETQSQTEATDNVTNLINRQL